MRRSTIIAATYSVMALVMAVGSSFLIYQAWVWQPAPDTMEHELRLVALCALPLVGLSLVVQVVCDPLAWRVRRLLRRKEHLADAH